MRLSILLLVLSGCAPAAPAKSLAVAKRPPKARLAELSAASSGAVLVEWPTPPPEAARTCVHAAYAGALALRAHLAAGGAQAPVLIKPGMGSVCYRVQLLPGEPIRLVMDEPVVAQLRVGLESENIGQ